MAEIDEFKELRERGLDRILGLSDGIFAFAITLMVLDLAVPAIGQGGTSALPSLLASESVSFINYFLSFAIIAIWWNAHHRNFEYINDYNGLLKVLNLMVLLSITLVPFFTKLLDAWNLTPFATALYAMDQGLAGLFLALTWWYATKKHRFVDSRLNQRAIDRIRLSSFIAPIVFFVSIPLAFISQWLCWVSWFAMIPVTFYIRRRYK
jgi:uncharacterized membrane protein